MTGLPASVWLTGVNPDSQPVTGAFLIPSLRTWVETCGWHSLSVYDPADSVPLATIRDGQIRWYPERAA